MSSKYTDSLDSCTDITLQICNGNDYEQYNGRTNCAKFYDVYEFGSHYIEIQIRDKTTRVNYKANTIQSSERNMKELLNFFIECIKRKDSKLKIIRVNYGNYVNIRFMQNGMSQCFYDLEKIN